MRAVRLLGQALEGNVLRAHEPRDDYGVRTDAHRYLRMGNIRRTHRGADREEGEERIASCPPCWNGSGHGCQFPFNVLGRFL